MEYVEAKRMDRNVGGLEIHVWKADKRRTVRDLTEAGSAWR